MPGIKQQENFGRAVKAIRSRLGLTQAEFGSRVGCNQNTISRYEAGKLFPSHAVLTEVWKLADSTEIHLLRAFMSEWFSLLDQDGQNAVGHAVERLYQKAGVLGLGVVARMERLYEKHKKDTDVDALFEQAIVWLEMELKMRSVRRRGKDNRVFKD